MAADAPGIYRESAAFDCIERCLPIIQLNILVNAAPIEKISTIWTKLASAVAFS
jgi:hypothetical protein